MYREMEAAGLPEPEYRTVEYMLYATLKNQKWMESQKNPQVTPQDIPQVALQVEVTNEEKLLAFCTCVSKNYWGNRGRSIHHVLKKDLNDRISEKADLKVPKKAKSSCTKVLVHLKYRQDFSRMEARKYARYNKYREPS